MPHNSLQTSCLALAVAVALLVQADPALAQFNSTELGCRASIAKQGSKVVTTAAKVFAKCHKKRAAGKLSALLMCNTESDADTSGKIDKASTKLAANIATRCAGLVPGDLLYDDCPAPCDVAVPALNNFTDVADCLICTLEGEAAALSTTLRGDPAPPLAKQDGKCFGSVERAYSKVVKTLLKERTRCQNDEELAGAMDTATCTGTDPRGKIGKAETNGEEKIAKSCADANLTNVTGCSDASVAALQLCTLDESDVVGERIFQSFYSLSSGSPMLPAGDDFNGASLDPMWSVLNAGLVTIDVSGGSLNLVPTASGMGNTWFNDSEGPLIYKSVTGDFDVRTVIATEDSGIPANPPPPAYRLAGLLARDPASVPGSLNWVHVALGSGSNVQGTSYEYKSTDESVSNWMTTPTASPAGELRIVRTAADFDLYWRADAVSAWTLIQSFNRPDLPATLDVGLMIYSTDAPPSIRARFDEIAFF